MLTRRSPARADGGFTLVELIVSIAVLGVVAAGLTALMLGALTTNRQTATRLTESRDIQFATAYLADDVQGATSVVSGVTARCGTGTAVLELRGASYTAGSLAARVTVVSYVLQTPTVDGVPTGQLHRLACEADAQPAPAYPLTPASDITVARSLVPADPVVACAPAPCSAATSQVSLTLTSISGDQQVTVGGTRRTTP
jgi:prepilin-type N-terminal cleavage/methylation domain-containing protein